MLIKFPFEQGLIAKPARQPWRISLLASAAFVAFVCLPVQLAAQTMVTQTSQEANPVNLPGIARPAPVTSGTNQLAAIGPWGASASSEAFPALPATLWSGSEPQTLAILLARITADQRLPIMQQLVRRTLFSGGAAPTDDVAVMAARFDAAARLGPARDAARLWESVPRLLDRPELAIRAIDANFLAGDLERGCGIVRDIRINAPSAVLLEQAAVCYALQRETSAAQVAIDLARSEPDPPPGGPGRTVDDAWMERTIVAMSSGGAVRLPGFKADTPRAFGLSLAAGQAPAAGDLGGLSAPVLSTLALRAGPIQREAAAAAARQSTLTPGAWRTILPPPDPQPQPILPTLTPQLQVDGDTGVILPPPPPVVPPVQGTAFAAELRAADSPAKRASVARRLEPFLSDVINPAQADASLFAEALLWAGDTEGARRFLALAGSTIDPRLMLAQTLLDPDNPSAVNGAAVVRVIDRASTDAQMASASRLAAAAWAAGHPMTGGQAILLSRPASATPAIRSGEMAALKLASERGALAETVLLAALVLQERDAHLLDAATAVSVIEALRHVGLEYEARQLAAELVLADLIPVAAPVTRPAQTSTPASTTPPRPAAARPATTPAPIPPAPTTRPATATTPPRTTSPPPARSPAAPAATTARPAARPAPPPAARRAPPTPPPPPSRSQPRANWGQP
jgi:hypothetical protein